MDGSHEKQQVFSSKVRFKSLTELFLPARPVTPNTIPIKCADLPIGQLVNIGFGSRRRYALIAVMKIVRQFPQRWTGFNFMRIKQPVLGEFNRVRLSPFGLLDRSDL